MRLALRRLAKSGSNKTTSFHKYSCVDTLIPLYSMPHFSLTMTGLPVKSFRNGFGLTGTVCKSLYVSI